MKMTLTPLCTALMLCAAQTSAQDVRFEGTTVDACLRDAPAGQIDPACIGAAGNACQIASPRGEITMGVTQCLVRETEAWDALLNREYAPTRTALG